MRFSSAFLAAAVLSASVSGPFSSHLPSLSFITDPPSLLAGQHASTTASSAHANILEAVLSHVEEKASAFAPLASGLAGQAGAGAGAVLSAGEGVASVAAEGGVRFLLVFSFCLSFLPLRRRILTLLLPHLSRPVLLDLSESPGLSPLRSPIRRRLRPRSSLSARRRSLRRPRWRSSSSS
jgi:hypothetical protein